jgi:hypothetical protein
VDLYSEAYFNGQVQAIPKLRGPYNMPSPNSIVGTDNVVALVHVPPPIRPSPASHDQITLLTPLPAPDLLLACELLLLPLPPAFELLVLPLLVAFELLRNVSSSFRNKLSSSPNEYYTEPVSSHGHGPVTVLSLGTAVFLLAEFYLLARC